MLTPKIRKISNYLRSDGRSPFEGWFEKFKSSVVKARISIRIERAGQGNFGKYRYLGEIYELKEDLGPGYRIYFGVVKNEMILLLVGGDKSSQTQDIEKARAYWNDFERRTK